jgi:nitrate/nitrite-specific signal transduction histidine kinase
MSEAGRIEELLRENEKLRIRVAELEKQLDGHESLASLYVAAYQLHATFELHEVVQIIVEILINLVGAKTFAVFLYDPERRRFRPVAAEGTRKTDLPERGTVSVEPSYGHARQGARPSQDEPAINIPLRIRDQVVGMIAIWEMLRQKTGLSEVDYDIFNLLGTHAASALEAARLRAEARSSKQGFALFEEIN